ncbi:DUF1564 family protein [Leptospira sp. WS92.C1]
MSTKFRLPKFKRRSKKFQESSAKVSNRTHQRKSLNRIFSVISLFVGIPTFHRVYSFIWQLDLQNLRISRYLKFEPELFQHIFYGKYSNKPQ